MTAAPLLPLSPRFIARLGSARHEAAALFQGPEPQAGLSGVPADFDGYRPYVPGDDIRWIDWNLYARQEELFVKVFRVEDDRGLLLLVDASASMTAGGGRKYQVAAAAAAAFAHIGVALGREVTLCRYAEKLLDIEGPHRIPEGVAACTRRLLSPLQGSGTDLEQSLLPLLDRERRPLTVIALSDGFQERPLARAFAAARSRALRHLLFVRIEDERDLRPRLRGTLLALDPESRDSLALFADREFERRFHDRVHAHLVALESALREGGVATFSLGVEGSFEERFFALIGRPRVPARR